MHDLGKFWALSLLYMSFLSHIGGSMSAQLARTGLYKVAKRLLELRTTVECNRGNTESGIYKGTAVNLFPLHPASLTHKNLQRHKVIHGMRPIGRKE